MSEWTISIDASYRLTVDEVWPDGDAPDDPTAEDVARCMEASGDAWSVLSDWGLLDDLDVTVDGVGVWER